MLQPREPFPRSRGGRQQCPGLGTGMWQRSYGLLVLTLWRTSTPTAPGAAIQGGSCPDDGVGGGASTQRPSDRMLGVCPRWSMALGQPDLLQHGSWLQTHPDMAMTGCHLPPAPAQPAAEALGWVNKLSLDARVFPVLTGGSGGLCQAVKWSWRCTAYWSLFGRCVTYVHLAAAFTGHPPAESDGWGEERSMVDRGAVMGEESPLTLLKKVEAT